jgi:hypothetical protein
MKHNLSLLESDIIYWIDTGSSMGCLVENVQIDKTNQTLSGSPLPREAIEQAVRSLIKKGLIRVSPDRDGNTLDPDSREFIDDGWFFEINWRQHQIVFNQQKSVYKYNDSEEDSASFTATSVIDPTSTQGIIQGIMKGFTEFSGKEQDIDDYKPKHIFLKKK